MDCAELRRLINRYIDGELGYVETADFRRHVAFCPDCSLELRELSDVRGALARWGQTELAPAPGFADRVMDTVAGEPLPGAPPSLGEVFGEALDELDRILGKVPLPGGRSIPVKNVIGWSLAVYAGFVYGRRRARDERAGY
jgi:hypothetical protein